MSAFTWPAVVPLNVHATCSILLVAAVAAAQVKAGFGGTEGEAE